MSNVIIEDIIAMEWEEFQKVNNEGGRAVCQDDWKGFHIYRKSQFSAWNGEMLKSYHADLTAAKNEGRNLLTEKYARMMESAAPEEFHAIRDVLPAVSPEKKRLIAGIVEISLQWDKEFALEYPGISKKGRPSQASEDGRNDTSVETYLKGELATYSLKTLRLYYDYIKQLLAKNNNLSKMIMENTVREFGYSSLDQAEEGIAR